jgi:hypothetical protein
MSNADRIVRDTLGKLRAHGWRGPSRARAPHRGTCAQEIAGCANQERSREEGLRLKRDANCSYSFGHRARGPLVG